MPLSDPQGRVAMSTILRPTLRDWETADPGFDSESPWRALKGLHRSRHHVGGSAILLRGIVCPSGNLVPWQGRRGR